MSVQSMSLNVPEAIFTRLRLRAERANRTVEAEVLDVLATAVPVVDELPADLAAALSSLTLLDEAALWQTARSRLPAEAAAALEGLNRRQQKEGLSAAEAATQAELVGQ